MRDSQGNHVSLRDYIERIFNERQAALELAFKAQQDALSLASRTLERLEKLNELRQEVTSDRGNFVTREKHEADLEQRDIRIAEVTKKLDQLQGGMNVARFLGASGVAALIVELARLAGAVR